MDARFAAHWFPRVIDWIRSIEVDVFSEPGYKLNLVAGSDVVGPYRYENTDIQHSAGSYADAKRLLCHDIANEADMWRGSLRRALEALARTGENVLVADHERT